MFLNCISTLRANTVVQRTVVFSQIINLLWHSISDVRFVFYSIVAKQLMLCSVYVHTLFFLSGENTSIKHFKDVSLYTLSVYQNRNCLIHVCCASEIKVQLNNALCVRISVHVNS